MPNLSWTSYKLWKAGDEQGLKDYYEKKEIEPNEYLIKGKTLHYLAEMLPVKPEILELVGDVYEKEKRFEVDFEGYKVVGVLDIYSNKAIVDYKTGGLGGYSDQLNIYKWAGKLMGWFADPAMYLAELKLSDDEQDIAIGKIQKTKPKDIDWNAVFYQMFCDLKQLNIIK